MFWDFHRNFIGANPHQVCLIDVGKCDQFVANFFRHFPEGPLGTRVIRVRPYHSYRDSCPAQRDKTHLGFFGQLWKAGNTVHLRADFVEDALGIGDITLQLQDH